MYQAIAISHVWVVSFIAEPGKTSPPYSTAASTGKLCNTCGVRNDYNKKLSLFRVKWKLFSKCRWKLNLFLISSLRSWDVFLTVETPGMNHMPWRCQLCIDRIFLRVSIHYFDKCNFSFKEINCLVFRMKYECVVCEAGILYAYVF